MKYGGVYRGVVVSVDPVTLKVRCKIPSVTHQRTVVAEACMPPGWTGAEFIQDHPAHAVHPVHTNHVDHPAHVAHSNHGFTDYNDGTGSTGNKSVSLAHDNNHGPSHPHDGHSAHTDHGGPHVHTLASRVPTPGREGVWVMYEEGEVEHPVWIGTFKIGGN